MASKAQPTRATRSKLDRHRDQEDSFHVAFSDLFAGLGGVFLLLTLAFVLSITALTARKPESQITTQLAKHITRMQFGNGHATAVYCQPDGILVPELSSQPIPLASIPTDQRLIAYLRNLYLNETPNGETGRVLLMVQDDGFRAKNAVDTVLRELCRENEKFAHTYQVWVHENLDFVINETIRKRLAENLKTP